MPKSVFLQFEFPTPVAWFYAAAMLTIAIYFQFGRIFSLRNLDVLGLFLFVPGFLLLGEAHQSSKGDPRDPSAAFLGYVWLLAASGFWFVRCLLDIAASKRPRVAVNLSTPGLFWFAGALLLGLCVAAATRPAESETIGKRPAQFDGLEEGVTVAMQQADPVETKIVVARCLAIACQIAVAILLLLIGAIHFRELSLGVSAAALYLLLPFTGYRFDQSHHVWPTALLLGALLSYRRPIGAGVLFGLAVGTSFFPIVLLPVWLQFYRGRGKGIFAAWFSAFALLGLAGTVPALVFGGEFTAGIWQSLHLADWQPWGISRSEGIWSGVHWAYRLPVFIAFVGLVCASAFWLAVRDLGQLLAVCSVLLIGTQFWFADCGGAYVLWYAPLLILMILRPSTADLQPPEKERAARTGWLRRRRSPVAAVSPSLAV